jgi:hypothetical protein
MKFIFSLLLISFSLTSFSQEKFTLSGRIKDAKTGEEIIGATIYIPTLQKGASANEYGFYSITLPSGIYEIKFSSVGYADNIQKVELTKNITLNLELGTSDIQLEEVVVIDEKKETTQEKNISMVKMDMKKVKELPALFGEVDLLKTIQLMPGIQSAGDGNAGFNVRGGGSDQNLILLDEATVYNAAHLFGFFSVFNPDAVKDIDIYKGGIPAKYGGRLSALLDVRMKDGNSKKFSGSGGLGIISSRLTLEAPIDKGKGSFIISGRRTYADLFLKLSKNEDLKNNQLYFYDFNVKANYQLSDKDRLYASGYFGRDVLGLAGLFGFNWGNATGTLRWNHVYNQKLFSNITFIYSNFDYGIKIDLSDTQNFKVKSGINDVGLKADYSYFYNPKSTIYFGAQSIYHIFNPGEFTPLSSEAIFSAGKIDKKHSLENAIYIDHKYDFSNTLSIRYGLRVSMYNAIGSGKEFILGSDNYTVLDTITYENFDPIKTYIGPEPRVALSYALNENSSLKGSWDHTYQYIHQVSNSASSLPTDTWLTSGLNLKPQISDQAALGWFHNFPKGYEVSVETYYKWMQNQIDYRDSANLTFNEAIERELLVGKGWSYGAEFLVMKNEGKLTGWIGYTWAKTLRDIEGINNNEPYFVKNDRRHNISIVATYKFTERLKASATWVYATGNAITFPSSRYEIDGEVVSYYSGRNNYRMPAYHRGDISITLDAKPKYKDVKPTLLSSDEIPEVKNAQMKEKRSYESSWNISVYNVYNRENAFSITFRQQEDNNGNFTGRTEAVQTTLFKIIPSITWNFKF